MPLVFSEEEVAKHNSATNCWLVLGARSAKKVYDVTAFLEDHPGGPEVLMDLAGQDAEEEFQDVGHSKAARVMLEELFIGNLKEDGDQQAIREANKLSRRSLLTHPELIQRRSARSSSVWSRLAMATAFAIAVAAFVLLWAFPDVSLVAWEALRTAWLSML